MFKADFQKTKSKSKMSFSTSVCFCDGTSSMNYTHRKSLSELEVICFDTRNMPEIPSLVSENIFKTLSLPLRPNNFDLLSISFLLTVRNTCSGRIFGASFDPYITFPRSEDSLILDNVAFHPLISDQNTTINFI